MLTISIHWRKSTAIQLVWNLLQTALTIYTTILFLTHDVLPNSLPNTKHDNNRKATALIYVRVYFVAPKFLNQSFKFWFRSCCCNLWYPKKLHTHATDATAIAVVIPCKESKNFEVAARIKNLIYKFRPDGSDWFILPLSGFNQVFQVVYQSKCWGQ